MRKLAKRTSGYTDSRPVRAVMHYHSPKLTARIIATAWSANIQACTEAGRGASDNLARTAIRDPCIAPRSHRRKVEVPPVSVLDNATKMGRANNPFDPALQAQGRISSAQASS